MTTRAEVSERPDPRPGGRPPARPPETPRATWWILFGAFLVGLLAWSVATPMMSGPDEGSHAIRAAAVARGELTGPRRISIIENWVQRVPEAYARTREANCFIGNPFEGRRVSPISRTPECVPEFRGSDRRVPVLTYQFRGTPHVYGLLGLPTLISPDRPGMYGMRVLHALACAALLASATLSALRRRGRPAATAGVLLAATPMVWYLGGQVNPNGLEIVAAIALWAAITALAAGDSAETDTRLVTRAGVALATLLAIRALGPAFAAAALTGFLLLAPADRRRTVLGLAVTRIWLALGAVSLAVTTAWLSVVGLELAGPTHPAEGLTEGITGLIPIWRQTVGSFGIDYQDLPGWAPWLWSVPVLLGLTLALRYGRTGVRLLLGLLVLGTIVTPVTADGFNLPNIGFPWQGRYGLPLTVGVVIVAFGLLDDRHLHRVLARAATAIALALPVIAFVAVGRRLSMGIVEGGAFWDYLTRPRWQPGLPNAFLLALTLLAVGTIGAVVARPRKPGAADSTL